MSTRCSWVLVSRKGDTSRYRTSCGNQYSFEAPMEVGMWFPPLVQDTEHKFCLFCGGEIEPKDGTHGMVR